VNAAAAWVTVGRVADVPEGHAARVVIDGTPVAIFHTGGEFHCIDDTCSHAEASLSDGDLDPRRCAIECPLHGSAFDLRTGEALTPPAVEAVRVHAIDTSGGLLRVALQEA
jgi:3-phenylpropionate/trans-cinnamate dioxygenase ferredoxin subunit